LSGDVAPEVAPVAATVAPIAAIAERLGSPVVGVAVVDQATRTTTCRLTLADGRVVAAQRFAGPESAARAETAARIVPRLAAAGIPVASPVVVVEAGTSGGWLISPWIAGDSGRVRLDDPRSADRLAADMGALARRLATVDTAGIALDASWETPDRIVEDAIGRLAHLSGDLDSAVATAVRDGLRALDRSLAEAAGPATAPSGPRFAHGDLAPINVIVAPDGEIRALIDLETVRRAVPLLDAAWWSWIVRYHHPDSWPRLWAIFRRAADISSDPTTETTVRALQLARILELAAAESNAPARTMWLTRLAATAAWPS
jgi:aminoglycoside phosphotransferase (APT) family kinase protein